MTIKRFICIDFLLCFAAVRKALIRKHYLLNTIYQFVVKNPYSILTTAFPAAYHLEVDYAEFLDDALDEAFELRSEIEQGDSTWILKPSMSDRGQGIRIFRTIDGLQEIFDSFEEQEQEQDNEEEEEGETGVVTSQMRHFVVQKYVANPLLLAHHGNRKFHVRTYVIAVGAIKVYVYQSMLALFALSQYNKSSSDEDVVDLIGHLTNTCLQGESKDDGSVSTFWELNGLDHSQKKHIYDQICAITGDVFKAAITTDRFNFQPLPNAFELYGLDFLVDDQLNVSVLEVNAYPDFKQTGDELKNIIVGLLDAVTVQAVAPFFSAKSHTPTDERLSLVLDQDIMGGW